MSQKTTMLEKMAKGIKRVADHVDEKNSFTAIGFYKPKKAEKAHDAQQK